MLGKIINRRKDASNKRKKEEGDKEIERKGGGGGVEGKNKSSSSLQPSQLPSPTPSSSSINDKRNPYAFTHQSETVSRIKPPSRCQSTTSASTASSSTASRGEILRVAKEQTIKPGIPALRQTSECSSILETEKRGERIHVTASRSSISEHVGATSKARDAQHPRGCGSCLPVIVKPSEGIRPHQNAAPPQNCSLVNNGSSRKCNKVISNCSIDDNCVHVSDYCDDENGSWQNLINNTMKEQVGTDSSTHPQTSTTFFSVCKPEPSVAKVPPMLQARQCDSGANSGNSLHSNAQETTTPCDTLDDSNIHTEDSNDTSGRDSGQSNDQNNDSSSIDNNNVHHASPTSSPGDQKVSQNNDLDQIKFNFKPMGPLRIQDTPDYGLFELYSDSGCRKDAFCGDKRYHHHGSCSSGKRSCRNRVSCRSRGSPGHESPSRCGHGSPRKCRRRFDCNSNSGSYTSPNRNCCGPIEDSLDDTSSLSSESVTTTTTTSSSMSSSTYGDISCNSGHHNRNHQSQNHQNSSRSPAHSRSSVVNSSKSTSHRSSPTSISSGQRTDSAYHSVVSDSSSNHHQNQGIKLSPQPPPTPTHGPRKGSPRKTIKKTDSSIQTESSSLLLLDNKSNQNIEQPPTDPSLTCGWKKYFNEQPQMMIKNGSGVYSDSETVRLRAPNQNSRIQPSDSYPINTEALRAKLAAGSYNKNNLLDDASNSSFSPLPSSPSHQHNHHHQHQHHRQNSGGGKAVAVIKANSATTGRIPNQTKTQVPSRIIKSNNTPSSSPLSYGDTIYSDSEYVQYSSSSYYSGKYSYLTSPIRFRGGTNTFPSRSGITANCGDGGTNDLSGRGGYGQIGSNFYSKRNGFSADRNALTETESMESLAHNVAQLAHNRRSNSAVTKSGLSNIPSTPTRCPMPPPSTPSRMSGKLRNSNNSIPNPANAMSDSNRKQIFDKETGDLYSSALSLVSNSTIFTQIEDKHGLEMRKLKRDLEQANEKVATLTSQLNTNAHMVTAFEQSLGAMTARLQQLTVISEKKDGELSRLRSIMEELNRRREGGHNSVEGSPAKKSSSKKEKDKKSFLTRRHTFANPSEDVKTQLTRHRSRESMSSTSDHEVKLTNEYRSNSKANNDKKYSNDFADSLGTIPVSSSRGWLRSSLTKAFRRSRSSSKSRGSVTDNHTPTSFRPSLVEGDSCSMPNSPLLPTRTFHRYGKTLPYDQFDHMVSESDKSKDDEFADMLKNQLMEKEKALTDLRLEALAAAHQLDNFKEMMNRMHSEMQNLKHDNDRLQRMIMSNSMASSKSSELSSACLGLTSPTSEQQSQQPSNQQQRQSITSNEENSTPDDNRKVNISIAGMLIGSLKIGSETTWSILDNVIRKTVQDYLDRIDPNRELGLSLDCIAFYEVGTAKQVRSLRSSTSSAPELLPFGYIDNESNIVVHCKSHLDRFAFETLIPKPIIQRFVSLLNEHKRLILYGPSGVGKTYLAQKIAEFLVMKLQKGSRMSRSSFESDDLNSYGEYQCPPGSIATFTIDEKSASELKSYLSTLEDQLDASSPHELPTVVILDNLHHVTSIDEVFGGNLTMPGKKFPLIIGTMCQNASTSNCNLQTNHHFRWLLCANHMEPVQGLLHRYLRRKLVSTELEHGSINVSSPSDMISVVDWITQAWSQINCFIEKNHSSELTLGPGMYLSCPMEMEKAKKWFIELWNLSIRPYLIHVTRDGIQRNGLRGNFEDPSEWILKTCPWRQNEDSPIGLGLNPLKLEDLQPQMDVKIGNTNSDPLSDMLKRLQVATTNLGRNCLDSCPVNTSQSSSVMKSTD